ncbi:MAG: hypothetical protein ACLUW6_07735 [Coriobacteriaceae bacterium]
MLVNAKDVLPSKEDTVVLETTSLVPPRCGGRRPELEGNDRDEDLRK